MEISLLISLIAICSWDAGVGLINPRRFLELPTLTSVVYLGWVLPQAYAIACTGFGATPGLTQTLFVALELLIAVKIGWALSNRGSASAKNWLPTTKQLTTVGFMLTLAGSLFSIWIRLLPIELTGVSEWTGIPTIIEFFTKIQLLALAFSLIGYLRTKSRLLLLMTIWNGLFFLLPAVWYVRREPLIELGLLLLSSLWFARRWIAPRILLAASIALLVIVVNSAGAFRNVMLTVNESGLTTRRSDVSLQDFADIDVTILKDRDPMNSEFGNAVHIINSINDVSQLSFGIRLWDSFIFGYFPGQWFGFDLKESLQFYKLSVPASLGIETGRGTTITAFADLFEAFGYAGPIIYIFVGAYFGRIFIRALSGNFYYQYFYSIALIVPLLSLSHGFLLFAARMPALLIFSALAFWPLRAERNILGRQEPSKLQNA